MQDEKCARARQADPSWRGSRQQLQGILVSLSVIDAERWNEAIKETYSPTGELLQKDVTS